MKRKPSAAISSMKHPFYQKFDGQNRNRSVMLQEIISPVLLKIDSVPTPSPLDTLDLQIQLLHVAILRTSEPRAKGDHQ